MIYLTLRMDSLDTSCEILLISLREEEDCPLTTARIFRTFPKLIMSDKQRVQYSIMYVFASSHLFIFASFLDRHYPRVIKAARDMNRYSNAREVKSNARSGWN